MNVSTFVPNTFLGAPMTNHINAHSPATNLRKLCEYWVLVPVHHVVQVSRQDKEISVEEVAVSDPPCFLLACCQHLSRRLISCCRSSPLQHLG